MADRSDADELVVVRCQLGEPAAFHELVARWHRPIHTFVERTHGVPARTDDLTQEVWLRVVRGLPRLDDPARFPAWLFTLARRTVLDELRRAYRRPVETAPLDDDAALPAPPDRSDLDDLLDRLTLDRALAVLTPADRETVVLFHLDELPIPTIAEVLDIPPGTVRSRLHRARRQLRAALDQEETT